MSIPATTATDLHGTLRITTDEERAAVRAVFERQGTPLPESAVAVVFAYPGHGVGERHPQLSGCTNQMLLLSTAAGQLSQLGITVVAASTEPAEKHVRLGTLSRSIARFTEDDAALVPHTDLGEGRFLLRWTMVLGGPRDGLLVTGITDSVAHTRAVIDLLTADRLRGCAEVAGADPASASTGVTATYTNGAGSLGIVAFEAGIPLVAKVGPRAVIDAETAFVTQVNAELAARGNPPLFPVLHGVHHEGAQATSLMEQVEPLTLDNVVFSDKAKFVLADDALSALEPHLRMLGAFYTSATRPQRPTVADYLFRERFHAVVEHEGAETIRQVGAGLAYAHSRQVGHGALTTRAVMGIPRPARGKLMSDGWLDPGLQITDWHHAAAAGAGTPTADAVTRDLRGLAAVAREICAGTPAAGLAELPDRLATEPDFARLDPAQQVQRLTRRLAAAALH